jgi:cytochrome c-type biogenesis protein
VLSFLSPCVLPLVPSYLTFVTGMSLDDVQRVRRATLVHALLFVLGFTVVFILLGATATLVGRLLGQQRVWLTRAGGVLVIVFGLYLLGVLNVTPFTRERRVHLSDKPAGYLGSVLVGFAFGAGWTPCIGPILGGILTYTATQADFGQGIGLLLTYALGLAVPFVLSAVAVERLIEATRAYSRHLVWVSRVSGVLVLALGILMLTGYLPALTQSLQALTPAALRGRL